MGCGTDNRRQTTRLEVQSKPWFGGERPGDKRGGEVWLNSTQNYQTHPRAIPSMAASSCLAKIFGSCWGKGQGRHGGRGAQHPTPAGRTQVCIHLTRLRHPQVVPVVPVTCCDADAAASCAVDPGPCLRPVRTAESTTGAPHVKPHASTLRTQCTNTRRDKGFLDPIQAQEISRRLGRAGVATGSWGEDVHVDG